MIVKNFNYKNYYVVITQDEEDIKNYYYEIYEIDKTSNIPKTHSIYESYASHESASISEAEEFAKDYINEFIEKSFQSKNIINVIFKNMQFFLTKKF